MLDVWSLLLSLLDQIDYYRLQKISYIASGFGFIVAASALVVSASANNANRKVQRATFWLNIRTMFGEHKDVFMKLQVGGPWYQSDTEPARPQDRAEVVPYLSLFEQVKFLLDKGLIDKATIDNTLLPYRVQLILQNGPIKRCLLHGQRKGEKKDWDTFKELVNDFDSRYRKEHKFPYRDMCKSEKGGGPEEALRDSGKRE